jgi:hypothetical protein
MAERELEPRHMGPDQVQLVRKDSSRRALAWWPVFLALQLVAFFVVLALDPAGFDPCDSTTPAGPRPVQAMIAGMAMVGSLSLGLWWLRRLQLIIALCAVACSGLAWLWLLGDSGTC